MAKITIEVLSNKGEKIREFEKETDDKPDLVRLANDVASLNNAVDLLILDSLGGI